jgi:formate hydrogenlyase subunit 3/multisubunit Na+/H+ antiporter MnhD subunit
MYPWVVLLHVAGVFGFLLAHGASVGAMLRLRTERRRERIEALIELSAATMTAFYASIVVLLGAGILAGFIGNWWRMLWIWISLGLFLAIAAAMYPLASGYFRRIRIAVGTRPSGAPMASDEEIDELLASSRPMIVAAIGFGGVLVIAWLMIVKPF